MSRPAELALAEQAARAAGAVVRAGFGRPQGVREKGGPRDLVSDVDLAAERAILARLRAARPADGVRSEERGELPGTSGRRWLVDPLDGTTNLAAGFPHVAVALVLEDADGPLLAVTYDPLRDELFAAERGGGATVDGRPLPERPRAASLREAVVALQVPRASVHPPGPLAGLAGAARDLRLTGSTCLDLAWVAAGRLDACLYRRGAAAWDWLGGELLVREAGGAVEELEAGLPGAALAAGAELAGEVSVNGEPVSERDPRAACR